MLNQAKLHSGYTDLSVSVPIPHVIILAPLSQYHGQWGEKGGGKDIIYAGCYSIRDYP